jgi:hypothetical protein
MTFGSSPEHRVLAKVLPWLAIGDSITYIISITNALCQQLVLTVAYGFFTFFNKIVSNFYMTQRYFFGR